MVAGAKPKYDVFLSFRGEDTRKNFVSHLYRALTKKGVHTFRDDRSVEKGKTIKDELIGAVEESRLAVIVFSANYASSRWCLEELIKIIECKIQRKQTVIPICYGINESEKCSIVDAFAEAFAKCEADSTTDSYFDEERVKSWRKALTEAIDSGWDVNKCVEQYYPYTHLNSKIDVVSRLGMKRKYSADCLLDDAFVIK
ncbi:PREDICTED: TMV resistance protein N-like isoform X2 [Nicotiana attenuata]|uniref:TMV resistance protein N-like isoform X2 n=1 Tax=Nicotiana attenuata TaxID=49451 RepID=UPI0009059892|nr:PREDICTED: TMV resistance protein N-like isoform X2 [Nicotiana attenuata]